jgi:MtrB/PioB family decaheme-associated outer membrane protein
MDTNRNEHRPMSSKTVPCAAAALLALAPALAARADDAKALTEPEKSVEVGAAYTSADSYKFGEYNGLEEQGTHVIGAIDMAGGGSYDSSSAKRWSLDARNLGLSNTSANAEFKDQGRFRIDLSYDSLSHNLSDSFHTFYSGAGSSLLTLPAGWIKPVVPQLNATQLNDRALSTVTGQGSVISAAGVVTAPTSAQVAALDAIIAADMAGFSSFDLHTKRKREGLGLAVNLTSHLTLTGSAQHETHDGYKMIGALSSAIRENSVSLPDLVDTSTDQFNLGLEYANKKAYLKAGYYGSVFRNAVKSTSWQDPSDPTRVATIGSAPDNQFHQFNVTGGYTFSPSTRLVADLSYGRGRQNETFLVDASMPLGVPVNSADATVVTRLANLKFTTRLGERVGLNAHYRYEDRDNQTAVNTFVFYDANLARGATASAFNSALGLAANTLASNVNIFANRPQQRTVHEFDVGSDIALGQGQRLSGAFEWRKTERTCEKSWYSCTNAPEARERTYRLDWNADVTESVHGSVGYSYGTRRVDYDPNAWLALVPMANVTPGAPIVGATTSVYGYLTANGLTGFGPLAGYPTTPLTGDAAIFSPNNNIVPQSLYGSRDNVSELPGMRRYDLADRNRHRARGMLDWQATKRLALQTSLTYDKDDYSHSQYGLQKSSGWTAGLDASYALSRRLTVAAFYTHETQRARTAGDGYGSNSNTAFIGRAGNTLVDGPCYQTVQTRNNNAKMDPCLQWTAESRDRADTFGLTLTRSGLLDGRLDLTANVLFTKATTDVGVDGGSYANNPFALAGAPVLPSGTAAVYYIPAADLPSVTTRIFDIRLGARYAISKQSDVRVAYAYQRLKAVDYAYDGVQVGVGTEVLPTNELAPNYGIHTVGVFYRHRF